MCNLYATLRVSIVSPGPQADTFKKPAEAVGLPASASDSRAVHQLRNVGWNRIPYLEVCLIHVSRAAALRLNTTRPLPAPSLFDKFLIFCR
jgi:hypothetical protein